MTEVSEKHIFVIVWTSRKSSKKCNQLIAHTKEAKWAQIRHYNVPVDCQSNLGSFGWCPRCESLCHPELVLCPRKSQHYFVREIQKGRRTVQSICHLYHGTSESLWTLSQGTSYRELRPWERFSCQIIVDIVPRVLREAFRHADPQSYWIQALLLPTKVDFKVDAV